MRRASLIIGVLTAAAISTEALADGTIDYGKFWESMNASPGG